MRLPNASARLEPAWLAPDAPGCDVVLSTRARALRNLRGRFFPARLSGPEAAEILTEVSATTSLRRVESPTSAEIGALVAARLVSSDHPWTEPGRGVFLDQSLERSLLVNEEDHLRLQAVSGGDALDRARGLLNGDLDELARGLEFARDPSGRYLAASVHNLGAGRRDSAMLHLVGLVSTGRAPAVVRALGARRVVVRGLFGETSRALGGYMQVSSVADDEAEFDGAVRYLVGAEREARSHARADHVRRGVAAARAIIADAELLTLADAVRALGWMRWEHDALRSADRSLALLDPLARGPEADRQRAEVLRDLL